jgi:hypothetical protein
MAGAGLTAMGIESFFVCSLLILLGLGKSEKSENPVKSATLRHDMRSIARAASAAPAATFKLAYRPCVDFEVSDYVEDAVRAYQESRRAASYTFLPRYIRDDSARAHVKHKRERYAENRNNQHGLLKASGAESFRDRG